MRGLRTIVLAVMLVGGLCSRGVWARQGCVDLEVGAVYSGMPMEPGVDDLGIHCDDCTATVVFPFPVRFYGMDYTSAVVSSNGNVQFAGASTQYQDECLPTINMDTTAFPLWDDLTLYDDGDGVFTSTTGDAPARVFNIEWRAHYYGQAGTANFEVRFFENSRSLEFVYGAYTGFTHTIGVQRGRGELYRYAACNYNTPFPAGTKIVFTETYTSSNGPFQDAFPRGVTDTGNHCDDCTTLIALPFPIPFYGEMYTSASVSSNGNMQFAGANPDYFNVCPPVATFGPTIFAHWDDLRTDGPGAGVFTHVSGTAPFRIFDVEWRANYYNGSGSVVFTLRFFENLDYFKLYFLTSDQRGANATLATQAGDERYEALWCNTVNGANPGELYTFSLPPMRVVSPGGYVPPCTDDIFNHCDDCTTALALPFTVSLFGEEYTSVNVSSNGNLQFGSNLTDYSNSCLPYAPMGTTIFGYWDDLRTDGANGQGIYTRVFGTAPNRALGIEWQAQTYATGATAHFEVVLSEMRPGFSVYFGSVPDEGLSATVGVQHGGGPEVMLYSCNAAGRVPVWVEFSCLGGPPPPPPCDLTIAGQPQGATACPDGPASLVVAATATDPPAYQWRVQSPSDPASWIELTDGDVVVEGEPFATISGSQSDTLVVTGYVSHRGSAVFDAVVSNGCASLTSDPATLTICRVDMNCDGGVNVGDYLAFLSYYAAADAHADYNGDGQINVADYLAFLAGYAAGC
jgi:hypothetical protein